MMQVCTGWVRGVVDLVKRVWVFVCLLVVSATVADVTQAQTRREAAGWLQLERDQTSYRERVGPLDLRDQRGLETVERTQRNALRALQQNQRRDMQAERRRASPGPDLGTVREVPRRDMRFDQRRGIERQRLQFRLQREQLPYSRRR